MRFERNAKKMAEERFKGHLVSASSVTKTKNTTSARQAAEYELFTNKTLLQNVVRIYFYDFILFGFDFPELRKR